jgi:hypothetical protein
MAKGRENERKKGEGEGGRDIFMQLPIYFR